MRSIFGSAASARNLAALAPETPSHPAGRSCTGWLLITHPHPYTIMLSAKITELHLSSLCRYNHEVLYNVLMYRRPEKRMFNLGGGIIYLNLPVGVPV